MQLAFCAGLLVNTGVCSVHQNLIWLSNTMRMCLGYGFGWVLLIAAYLFSVASAQQDVAFVQTAEELQDAVIAGIRHIIIQQHLDLRNVDPAVPGVLLVITSKTKSIRVRSVSNNATIRRTMHYFVSVRRHISLKRVVQCSEIHHGTSRCLLLPFWGKWCSP